MGISEKGLKLLQEFEGFSAYPYQDSVSMWTIGYGNTYYEDGTKVKPTDPPISKQRGVELLKIIVARFDEGVRKLCERENITLSENEHDALVCFAYNLGIGALASSTLWKQIVLYKRGQGTLEDVGKQWNLWVKAGGKTLKGLVIRRAKEFALFSQKV